MEAFLNCLYADGVDPDEYVVHFVSKNSGFSRSWCFVSKKDVLCIDFATGLVSVDLVSMKKDKALVSIRDLSHKASEFYVSRHDVFVPIEVPYARN